MFACFSQPKLPGAMANALRTTLFSNLFDDVWYSHFPRIPPATKERLVKGHFELTHMLDTQRQTLVVRTGGVWIGSLILLRGEQPRFVWTLPVTDQANLDALVGALLQVAGIDATERAQKPLLPPLDLPPIHPVVQTFIDAKIPYDMDPMDHRDLPTPEGWKRVGAICNDHI